MGSGAMKSVADGAAIVPIGQRVLIEPGEPDEKKGAIILPDVARERPTFGVAVAVGPDCKQVKVGDTVFFKRYEGAEVELPGGKVRVFKEEELLFCLVLQKE
jgi:chaperonin GroES